MGLTGRDATVKSRGVRDHTHGLLAITIEISLRPPMWQLGQQTIKPEELLRGAYASERSKSVCAVADGPRRQ